MGPKSRRLVLGVLGVLAAAVVAGCRPEPAVPPPPAAKSGVGQAATREDALAELQRSGAYVKVQGDGSGRKVTEVDFRAAPVGDDGLQGLRFFPELTFVGLLGCPVTDAGVEHLRPLTGLEVLVLGGTRITDAGLAVVADLPKLRRLEFQSTGVTDVGLAHLKKLKQLGYVKAGGTRVTDAGMEHLAGVPTLEYLNLVQTGVGDAGLAHLSRLPALKALYLDGNRVTDVGLAQLKAAGALEVVSVRVTAVTADGAQALQEGRPKLQVTRLVGQPDTATEPPGLHLTRPRPLFRTTNGPVEGAGWNLGRARVLNVRLRRLRLFDGLCHGSSRCPDAVPLWAGPSVRAARRVGPFPVGVGRGALPPSRPGVGRVSRRSVAAAHIRAPQYVLTHLRVRYEARTASSVTAAGGFRLLRQERARRPRRVGLECLGGRRADHLQDLHDAVRPSVLALRLPTPVADLEATIDRGNDGPSLGGRQSARPTAPGPSDAELLRTRRGGARPGAMIDRSDALSPALKLGAVWAGKVPDPPQIDGTGHFGYASRADSRVQLGAPMRHVKFALVLSAVAGLYALDRQEHQRTRQKFDALAAMVATQGAAPTATGVRVSPTGAGQREREKVIPPPYEIEAPDLLLIEVVLRDAITKQTDRLPVQPISGSFAVRPDGAVGLGHWGSVAVSGLTLEQAAAAVQKHLLGTEAWQQCGAGSMPPGVVVDVVARNSKRYYVVTRTGAGEQVYAFPQTGGETVLDALTGFRHLGAVASKGSVCVVRKAATEAQVLPVDWDAIARRGVTETNYQLLAGDRVVVSVAR